MVIQPKETKKQKTTRIRKENLDALKEGVLEKIKTFKNNLLNTGFEYEGAHIQSDDTSQAKLTSVTLNADTLTYPISWRSLENTNIVISDKATLTGLSNNMQAFVQDTLSKYWEAKDAINEATSLLKVNTIYNEYTGGDE